MAAGWLQRASEVHFSELATATVAIYLARWLATRSVLCVYVSYGDVYWGRDTFSFGDSSQCLV